MTTLHKQHDDPAAGTDWLPATTPSLLRLSAAGRSQLPDPSPLVFHRSRFSRLHSA